jgi:hypothetical protein
MSQLGTTKDFIIEFESINNAYNSTFQPNKLSIGLVSPIENYTHSPIPNMTEHLKRVQLTESLGLSAIWLRDTPFNIPSFTDAAINHVVLNLRFNQRNIEETLKHLAKEILLHFNPLSS